MEEERKVDRQKKIILVDRRREEKEKTISRKRADKQRKSKVGNTHIQTRKADRQRKN